MIFYSPPPLLTKLRPLKSNTVPATGFRHFIILRHKHLISWSNLTDERESSRRNTFTFVEMFFDNKTVSQLRFWVKPHSSRAYRVLLYFKPAYYVRPFLAAYRIATYIFISILHNGYTKSMSHAQSTEFL